MSQVVGESVALQRQLEHKAVTEKTLRADVNALTEQLHELKKRFASYDVDMRELAERLAEATAAKERHEKSLAKLRAELNETKALHEGAESRAYSLQSVLGSLKAEMKEARDAQSVAEGESRRARLELETATEAHAKLQDDCKFLIMENAALQASMASTASAAATAEKERQRLLDEMDRSKVERVLAKFMFRKQREKVGARAAGCSAAPVPAALRLRCASRLLADPPRRGACLQPRARADPPAPPRRPRLARQYLETLELHKETKDQIAENFRELARASQRYDDLDRELRAARRRAAVKEEHYAVQEADASKLAQENRLLLERATQMGALIEQLRADLTTAQRVRAPVPPVFP